MSKSPELGASERPQSPQYWREIYQGGSPKAEQILFEKLATEIMDVQLKNKSKSGSASIDRTFHAKSLLGVTNAKLHVLGDIPNRFRVGYFQPESEYRATVRISNASGTRQADYHMDMRGAAIRVHASNTESHDLLMTNFPFTHARNAQQFVAFAKAKANSGDAKFQLAVRLVLSVGPSEALRMLRNVKEATEQPIKSAALASYWSRGAILWGEAGPVRYLLRPAVADTNVAAMPSSDPEYLHRDIADRLRRGDVVFNILVQPFVSESQTPIEDGSIEWTETASQPIPIATLTIPKQDIDAAAGRGIEREVDGLAFSPWYTTDDFRPLGSMNCARKQVYAASSAHRLGYRFREHVPVRNVIVGKGVAEIFKVLNQFVPWHRLDWHLGPLNLSVFREELRAKNLIDTEVREAPPKAASVPPPIPEPARTARTYDGTYNDLSNPKMGSIGSTFGRNMTPVYRPDLFNAPNPITVSRELMTREAFIPARSLNLLAAAWIQFQVHDWVNHRRHDLTNAESSHDVVIPTPDESTWQSLPGEQPKNRMRIAGNIPVHNTDGYPVFENMTTPWWDGSEVYGGDADKARSLREGAKLRLSNGYLPEELNGLNVTGFNESWWLGLSTMHTLFAREHNAICDALRSQYRAWSDERIYQTARLIVCALIAKIHTVEWTPAILATKTIDISLHANWYGAPKDWLSQLGIWLFDTRELKGIPQTLPNHHGTPYSLTEEFAAVYRLHPLIPDDYHFVDLETGRSTTLPFNKIQGIQTDAVMRGLKLENVVYSFGIAHPGAITLHNYPRSLQHFQRSNGEIIDLSVVDVVRDRMRGVPRFNDFRAALHKPRITRWEELSDDPETVRRIKDLYGSLDMVDTMVGLYAEPPPQGFGFSDTAFRIFILMASRRLQSDRFLTVDYRPEVYSPLGLDWIEKNGMTSIILRHCPSLAASVPRDASAFAPFRPIAV